MVKSKPKCPGAVLNDQMSIKMLNSWVAISAFLHFYYINDFFLDTWTTGASFVRVATALSESSSIHSDALYHLTKDMSGIGLDPMSYSLLEPEPSKEETWAEESKSLLQVI